MAFGLSRLRLPPAQFWQMTLNEISWLAGRQESQTLPRNAFGKLMQLYPDE